MINRLRFHIFVPLKTVPMFRCTAVSTGDMTPRRVSSLPANKLDYKLGLLLFTGEPASVRPSLKCSENTQAKV